MKGILTLVSIAALLLALLPLTAIADMPVPNKFSGSVTVNGLPAPVGTEIRAEIEGAEGNVQCTPATVTTPGQYSGLLISSDSPNDDGKTIKFYIKAPGFHEAVANETATYSYGFPPPQTLDLSATAVPELIAEWTPVESEIEDDVTAIRTFGVKSISECNVTWLINGNVVQENVSVPADTWCNYTNATLTTGVWNVTAIASNETITVQHTWTWTVNPFTVELVAGWNLISFPIIPVDASADAVFASILDNMLMVYAYDASKPLTERWSWYDGTGGGFTDTLSEVSPQFAYWVRMNANDTLEISGTYVEPTGGEYLLYDGWNLIGVRSRAAVNASNYISGTVVKIYTWQDGSFQEVTEFEPGKGYWVLMSGTGTYP